MYHRIAESIFDPWEIAVSAATFERQLHSFARSYNVIKLSDIDDAFSGRIRNPLVITFDDGYLDNFEIALPLLSKYGMPATFFIPTGILNSHHPFWWDELALIFLQRAELPERCELPLPNFPISFGLGSESKLTSSELGLISEWKATSPPVTARTTLYKTIWAQLKYATPQVCQESMQMLREWSGSNGKDQFQCMGTREIVEIAANPFYEIGAHSVGHPLLQTLPGEKQMEEISRSKETLEQLVGKNVKSFAYPFGGFDDTTIGLVKNSGFDYAVSTENGSIKKRQLQKLKYMLPRIHVTNDFILDRS